ncbi:hypothetical protein BY996DRAFT_4546289, partial [Phakopsora pachyrhizi]
SDYSKWAYGGWLPINLRSQKMASREEGFDVQGGNFLFKPLKHFIDIDKLDGFIEIAWRANLCEHQSLPSHEPSAKVYTR